MSSPTLRQCQIIQKSATVVVSVLLAAMGLWFCAELPPELRERWSGALLRQLCGVAGGVLACAAAWKVGWKRMLRFAPWLFVAWLALVIYAVGFCPLVRGAHRFAFFGTVKVNVLTVASVVVPLFAAWVCERRRIRPWVMVTVLLVAAVLFFCGMISMNANRLAHIVAWIGGESPVDGWARTQYLSGIASSHVFGNAGLNLKYIPDAVGAGWAAASALMFGKWFPLAACALFCALGALLTAAAFAGKDAAKRFFAGMFMIVFVGPSLYMMAQNIGWVPVIGVAPVLAGLGAQSAIVFGFGLGLLMGNGSDSETHPAARKIRIVVDVCWAALFVTFAMGFLAGVYPF